jgi:hypothetical protein
LNEAHILFAQDRYREAVQRCRQVRDVLLGEDKPTWAERVLAPIILAEKAAMIDESIKALNRMGNVASHGAGIEVDRDSANYVIRGCTKSQAARISLYLTNCFSFCLARRVSMSRSIVR